MKNKPLNHLSAFAAFCALGLSHSSAFASDVLIFGWSSDASQAMNLNINFADSTSISINHFKRGWRNHNGNGNGDASNIATGTSRNIQYASYFTFKNPAASSKSVDSASLEIYTFRTNNANTTVNVQFSEIDSSADELKNSSVSLPTYEDMVTGEYGSSSFDTSLELQYVSFDLINAGANLETFLGYHVIL